MALILDDSPTGGSGPGYDYGYLGGGMYVPTPYVVPTPKKKQSPYQPKGTGSTYNEQVPKQASQPAKKSSSSSVSQAAAQQAISNVAAAQVATPQQVAAVAETPAATPAAAAATPAAADPAVVAPATTRDVVIPDITLDPTYQAQVAAYAQSLTDANTANTRAKSGYDTTYNNTLRNVGYDPNSQQFMANDRGTQYGSAFRGNLEDYTGRGLGYSSDYYGDLANLNNTFVNQVGQLSSARQGFRQSQDDALSALGAQVALQKTAALQSAAARVAANLGIDQSQVPLTGGQKSITVPVTS